MKAIDTLHIATSDYEGGAARSAYRLHQGLVRIGVQSRMLVKKKTTHDESVLQVEGKDPERDLFTFRLIQKYYLTRNRTTLSNTYFSLGYPGVDLPGHPLIQSARVLHLHWVTVFQSATSVAKLCQLGKPLVWTLHDQRTFTGGCHFSAGCTKYQTACRDCPQLSCDPFELPSANLSDACEALHNCQIVIVAPSRWLADCARTSRLFRGMRVEHIPYGIDTEVFRPRGKSREQLELDKDKFYLLFGADSGQEKRKGAQELIAALKLCLADPFFANLVKLGRVVLLSFGRLFEEFSALSMPFQSVGYVDTEERMSMIYSAADLFLLPSLEDNLPNTMLEAMSCGTPVVGFQTGGIPDVVADGICGKLAPAGDVEALAGAILSLIKDPALLANMRSECRRRIEEKYSLKVQAESYRKLYDGLNNTKPASSTRRASLGPHYRRIHQPILDYIFEKAVELERAKKPNASMLTILSRIERRWAPLSTDHAVCHEAVAVLYGRKKNPFTKSLDAAKRFFYSKLSRE